MLATLAIINMAIAGVLVTETADERTAQEPVAIVAVVEAPAYIAWAED